MLPGGYCTVSPTVKGPHEQPAVAYAKPHMSLIAACHHAVCHTVPYACLSMLVPAVLVYLVMLTAEHSACVQDFADWPGCSDHDRPFCVRGPKLHDPLSHSPG